MEVRAPSAPVSLSTGGLTLRAASLATTAEIADDRGAPLDLVAWLVEDALDRGLLDLHARGVVVTSAGQENVLGAAGAARLTDEPRLGGAGERDA